ncbi:MAG: hypothetical protein KatS3mg009_1677 [Acidimicrobiia bacterium]|nr:MAG: hypothetical protein KatS3mg009_1677 [Acidimicrobiia bacterium]
MPAAMDAPSSHRFTTDGGLALAVHDWGGTGRPVLLAHPTGFHGIVWAPVARRLVAAGCRVWSFDFRGHGDSDAPRLRLLVVGVRGRRRRGRAPPRRLR